MGKPTPESVKKEIIRLHFQGFTILEIQEQTGLSTGNISNIINEFKSRLNSGEYQPTISFVQNLKKNGISLLDACSGARFEQIRRDNGIDKQEFDDLVDYYIKSKENEKDPQKTLDCAYQVIGIQSQTGISLESLPSHIQDLQHTKELLEKEISVLQKKYKDADAQLKSVLKENEVKLQDLEEYKKIQKILRPHHLDMKNNSQYATMIENAHNSNYDVAEIASQLEKEGSSGQRIYQNKQKIKQQEIEIKQNRATIESQEDKLASNRDLLATLSGFSKIQIDEHKLKQTFTTINSISKKHNITPKNAYQNFYNTIYLYDQKLTIEDSIQDLRKTKERLGKDVDSLKIEKLTLQNQNKQLKQTKTNLEHDCEIIKNIHMNNLTEIEKGSVAKVKEIQKASIETGVYMIHQTKNINEQFLINFGNLFLKSLETNETIKNCYSLKAIPDIIKGKAEYLDASMSILCLLPGFIEIYQKNKIHKEIIDLLKDLQQKIMMLAIWKIQN